MGKIRTYLAKAMGWKIFVGKAPASAPPRSVILFPLQLNVLHCGLVGIVAIRGSDRPAAMNPDDVLQAFAASDPLDPAALARMEAALLALKQESTLQHALHYRGRLARLRDHAALLRSSLSTHESALETDAALSSRDIEALSGLLLRLKDIIWGLEEDVLRNQEKIADLAGNGNIESPGLFDIYERLNLLLNALDRLEVRGRDSLGIELTLRFAGPSVLEETAAGLEGAGLGAEFAERSAPGDLVNCSIRLQGDAISFLWKTACVTGELGRNCRELRAAVRSDGVLRHFLRTTPAVAASIGHTRWASVGAINVPNCHPLNNHSSLADGGLRTYPHYGTGPWAIHAALNGDIDNHAALQSALEAEGIRSDPRVTTDTKTIPLQIEKHLRLGFDLRESFRRALNDFEGSHAIVVRSNLEPGRVYLALRGSGQALFVGFAPRHHLFASEVYGLVEEAREFLPLNGESERVAGDPSTRGQIYVLSEDHAGLEGIDAMHYDGHPLTLSPACVRLAEITTRDIDRGSFPHFLLKEIHDAPLSIRKTLRGKFHIVGEGGSSRVVFNLGEEVVPLTTRDALARGEIRRIWVVGQGTAAVAGSAIAEALSIYLRSAPLQIQARKASDLSGFAAREDLEHSIVVAVTQSGTTTDTNRAVSMAREAGAHIIAIVNRRQSDITTKAHGIFYTSDGRDLEMSVASTKAFYAQIVAGFTLALYIAQILQTLSDERIAGELAALSRAPRLMQGVIERRNAIQQAAWELAPRKKYWALVGSGTNKVAADEVRIKLSELCYKTISSDIIEDKKHIDLSAEPLILVLAAGSPEIVTGDIVKDTAIFKAHAASVVVVADDGEERFHAVADRVFHVPRARFPVSVILNTLAGHIFGYYAARSLDAQAAAMRDFRSRLSEILAAHVARGYSVYESVADRSLRRSVDEFARSMAGWRARRELASLNTETAADLALLLKYATDKLPLEDFREDFPDRWFASSPLDALVGCLSHAIDELSRPVDAIRHQAKTVTVGTSRKVETLRGSLFDPLSALGFTAENLRAREVLTLKRLQTAVEAVHGFTLYRVRGLDEDGTPTDDSTVSIERRGGVSETKRSRVEHGGPLLGTKRTITRTGEIYAGAGRSDGAPILIIPLLGSHSAVEHLLLLQAQFRDDLSIDQKKEVLGVKWTDIRNILNESNIEWKDEYLGRLPVQTLLGEAPEVIAQEIAVRCVN